MEATFTQRDKALLLVLGIIIIVFAAVMIPSYGIMALITDRSETKDNMAEQTAANEIKLNELLDSGINPMYAESAAMAKNNLEKMILAEKYKVAKLSPVIDSSEISTNTARDWLCAVKYLNYVNGDIVLFDSIKISENEEAYEDSVLLLDDDSSYNVDKYAAEVSCSYDSTHTVIPYSFYYENMKNTDVFNPLAGYVVLASQLVRRGSIYIDTIDYSTTGNLDEVTIPVTINRPQNSKISMYAGEICECHSCGSAYYLEDYKERAAELEEGGTVACDYCETGIWDGSTIN